MLSLSTILNNTRNKIAKYGFSKTLKFFLETKNPQQSLLMWKICLIFALNLCLLGISLLSQSLRNQLHQRKPWQTNHFQQQKQQKTTSFTLSITILSAKSTPTLNTIRMCFATRPYCCRVMTPNGVTSHSISHNTFRPSA